MTIMSSNRNRFLKKQLDSVKRKDVDEYGRSIGNYKGIRVKKEDPDLEYDFFKDSKEQSRRRDRNRSRSPTRKSDDEFRSDKRHYNYKDRDHRDRRREKEDYRSENKVKYEDNEYDFHANSNKFKEEKIKKSTFVNDKPSFERSGLLAKERNTVNNTFLKYVEPNDSHKPNKNSLSMFVFEGDKIINTLKLSTKSNYLFGTEQSVIDVPLDHSCSKQHAVLQYRYVNSGSYEHKYAIKPYIIDLESENGTILNGKKIEASRFIELKSKDILQFGSSSLEYVVLIE